MRVHYCTLILVLAPGTCTNFILSCRSSSTVLVQRSILYSFLFSIRYVRYDTMRSTMTTAPHSVSSLWRCSRKQPATRYRIRLPPYYAVSYHTGTSHSAGPERHRDHARCFLLPLSLVLSSYTLPNSAFLLGLAFLLPFSYFRAPLKIPFYILYFSLLYFFPSCFFFSLCSALFCFVYNPQILFHLNTQPLPAFPPARACVTRDPPLPSH